MAKRAVNLSIGETVLAQAREAGVHLPRFLEEKLSDHTRTVREQAWLQDNREAIKPYNERAARAGPFNKDLISL